ncbi:MAG: peroxiredoxin-like family protein [Candidatus Angelobacter sp.]
MKWRSLEETSATDFRPLREIYAERKELIAKYVPAETQAIHAQTVADLQQLAVAGQALAAGAQAYSFQLKDHNGKEVSSAELLRNGPLVVCFFRGRWDPFCVGQLEAMNLVFSDIQKSGASLVAISPQTVHQSFLMRDQHTLRVPLLSDEGNNAAREFGLVYTVPEHQKTVYRRAFVNLPFANGDDSWTLPIPATYIVDRAGTVRYRWANEDYTERPEPVDIVEKLRTL